MVVAYSQLKRVLEARQMTVPELHRRIQQDGLNVNLKSLYRLSRKDQPLGRLDLRVAGVICHICRVPLSELITFELPKGKFQRLSTAKQKRLDVLMTKNNDGKLTAAEQEELRLLARETEEITLNNARLLAKQRKPLLANGG